MNVALVEHAQDDVDDDERCQNKIWRALQRGLKSLRRTLKGSRDRRRQADARRLRIDRIDGVTQRNPGRKIE